MQVIIDWFIDWWISILVRLLKGETFFQLLFIFLKMTEMLFLMLFLCCCCCFWNVVFGWTEKHCLVAPLLEYQGVPERLWWVNVSVNGFISVLAFCSVATPWKGEAVTFWWQSSLWYKKKNNNKSSKSHLLTINQSIFDKYHIVNTFTLYIYLIL